MSDEEIQESEAYTSTVELSTGSQVGIVAGFATAPAVAAAAIELLRMGFVGLGVGVISAVAVGVASKHLIDRRGGSAGNEGEQEVGPRAGLLAPITERLQNANWGALLQPMDVAERMVQASAASPLSQKPVQPEPQRPAPTTKRIDLAEGLQIDLDDIAGKAIFIAGMRRSGKTTLGAKIAEELGDHLIPLLIPDFEGDYISLADVLPRAVIAGHPSVIAQYGGYRFANVDPKSAPALGYDILEKGYQVILDLASYPDELTPDLPDLDTAITVQVGIIQGMFRWANAHPEGRVTCAIYLDEAQRYLPQNLEDSVIADRLVRSALLRTYMDLLAIGGKRGLAPIILTQRFAQVNKKIMAQPEVLFLLRQTFDKDVERCVEYIRKTTATEEMIAQFAQGQGVYIAADGSQCIAQFHRRRSNGERSQTPRAEGAQRYRDMPLVSSVSVSENDGNTVETPAKTASQAEVTRIIDNVFPVSRETQEKAAPSLEDREPVTEDLVSADLMEAIREMKKMGFADRDIAKLTKLSGRKYGIYQRVLRQLGYVKEGAQ